MGVSVGPGATTLTRMFDAARSRAAARDSPSTALARHVDGHVGHAAAAPGRAQVHDRAATATPHGRDLRLHGEEHPLDVGVEDARVRRLVECLDRPAGLERRAVHRHVEAPEALEREVHKRSGVGLDGHIGPLGQRRHATELLQQRGAGFFASASQDQTRAALREFDGGRAADAARGACCEDDFAHFALHICSGGRHLLGSFVASIAARICAVLGLTL